MKGRRPTSRLSIAAFILAASCSRSGSRFDYQTLPPSPTILPVAMADFDFVYSSRVSAGRVVFDVSNAGQFVHRLTLFSLPQGRTPLPESLSVLTPPPGVATVAITPELQPGDLTSLAVDLEIGRRYLLASLVVGPDGLTDAQRGMTSVFIAQAAH